MNDMTTLLCGDAIEILKTLPDKSVHVCITSPPFFGLRDYGTGTWEGGDPGCKHTVSNQVEDRKAPGAITSAVRPGAPKTCRHCGATRVDLQIGLEASPEEYVARLVEVFREVWRVLRDDGLVFLNLGDSCAGSGKGRKKDGSHQVGGKQGTNRGTIEGTLHKTPATAFYKAKDLLGIPWMVAFALRADGWYLRSEIIFAKPNAMPESVKDRPTRSHEQVFMLAKSRKYFYDSVAIAEPAKEWTGRAATFARNGAVSQHILPGQSAAVHRPERTDRIEGNTRNRRSVWTIPTKPYRGAHFAVFPEALVEPMLLCSTSERGCCPACGAPWRRVVEKVKDSMPVSERHGRVGHNGQPPQISGMYWDGPTTKATDKWLPTCRCNAGEPVPCTVIDPFAGASTVGVVCIRHGRNFIGIDLNPEYIELSRKRLAQVQPLLIGTRG